MRNTPNNITTLEPNQIFVFGSNLAGQHIGGAAKVALDSFGAVMGQGEGLQGQSYAFPTLDEGMGKRSLIDMVDSAVRLYDCALQHPHLTFLVTKVGCGIAGYSEEEMRYVFEGERPENVILPVEFERHD